MRETLKRVQARARALARSGKFAGWRAIAFELRFEPDCLEGLDGFQSPAAQEEIDCLCRESRAPSPSPRRYPGLPEHSIAQAAKTKTMGGAAALPMVFSLPFRAAS